MSAAVSIDLESGSGSLPPASFPLSLLTSIKATELNKVRILIVGDSGTGKSVLTSRLAGVSVKELKDNPYSSLNLGNTSGCQTECKLFEFKNHHALQQQQQQQQQYTQYAHPGSTMQHRIHSSYSSPSSASYSSSSSAGGSANSSSLYFVELWDVSGHRKFIPSRDVFYTGINGVIFVFDLMNRKSYENIRKWIKELVKVDRERGIEDKSGTTDTDLISPGGNLSASGIHRPPSRSNSNNPSPHHSPAFRPSPSPLHVSGTGSTAAVAAALHAASPVNVALTPSSSPSSVDSGALALGSMPVLIVGNKLDEYRTNSAEQGSYESIKDFGIDSVYVSALDSSSEQWAPVEKFFDRVIVHRYFRQLELQLQASALQSSTSRYNTTTPFAQTNVSNGVGNASYSAMSYAMSDLNQVGSGMSTRRMVAPTASTSSAIFPNSGRPPIPSYPSQYERRMSGGAVELQSPSVGYNSSTSPMHANNAASLSSASARREFTPPPIRTFADFTLSSPSSSTYSTIGGIEEESSPNSGTSPNVLAPSSAMDDWHARSNYATSYRATTTASATPSYLAGTGASSLPTNTALHALTQQSRLHSN